MNTTDVQVYDYVTDDGRRISISLAAFGEVDKDRTVNVSIVVDDVERLHTTNHTRCPANIKMGEWLIHGVLNCLCIHMEQFQMFQLMNNLMFMANADEPQLVPIDDRHISELTDQQAEWWNEDANHPLVDYLFEKVRPAVVEAVKNYPHLRTNKESN